MGFNTTVVIYNDALGMIRDDPEFGRSLYDAILNLKRGEPEVIYARVGMGGSTAGVVVESHHADHFVMVKVGMNYGEVMP